MPSTAASPWALARFGATGLRACRAAGSLLRSARHSPSRWPSRSVRSTRRPRALAANPAATVIAKYRARIPELMAEQGIPGLAVALVDADRTLWVEGFGHLDGRGSAPVTADTIFSVESMSKLFTATAVMQAVAAGRLDLDAPITTYLPEFTVHSAFEEHPERKITLRMLLSHTAGFTHEAPVGNNNELDPGGFDAHVRSISDTWLRFPVGSGYAYSNLGIDLAGYILERVEGKPFAEVMRDSLLEPLGMDHSTFDRAAIRATADRAVGHVHPYPTPPLDVPMTAAGGLYTSAADLARFLRFELNGGSIDGRVVLGPKWLDEMQTVPPPRAGAPAGYALGVVRHRWNRWDQRPDLFEHGGGGFGFLSDLWWLPQLGIGVAVLTNSQDHQLQNDARAVDPGRPRQRAGRLSRSAACAAVAAAGRRSGPCRSSPRPGWRTSSPTPPWPRRETRPPAGRPTPAATECPRGGTSTRVVRRTGSSSTPASPTSRPDDNADSPVRHRLAEVEPGLFLADNGETLDLRGPVPTWRNLRLVRVSGGPSTVAVGDPRGSRARRRRVAGRRAGAEHPALRRLALLVEAQRTATRRWRRVTALVASATALLMLANRGPARVDARARRLRVPGRARPVPG